MIIFESRITEHVTNAGTLLQSYLVLVLQTLVRRTSTS